MDAATSVRCAAMGGREHDAEVEGLTLRVRDAGDPDGVPVMHFHGTPGCRLELAWGEDIAAAEGVRLVTFDRPGYGGSSPAPFGLTSLARIALAVADRFGLDRFATSGVSGGGPFALAAAAFAPARVRAVGVMSGAGPFQCVPGALEDLSDIDREAVSLLPADPAGAAEKFASGFSTREEFPDQRALLARFGPALSDRDKEIVAEPVAGAALLADIREALRQGRLGGGWDNVAWVGPWDFDVAAVTCPVLLRYGADDRMAPPAHAHWLQEHLATATLVMRPGEGHFGVFDHLGEDLRALLVAAH
jgi:pimeloyl-ACP methyl ester carboxylesterase